MNYYLIDEKCTLCGLCVTICPDNAVSMGRGAAVIDQSRCSHCGECKEQCPEDAVRVFVTKSEAV